MSKSTPGTTLASALTLNYCHVKQGAKSFLILTMFQKNLLILSGVSTAVAAAVYIFWGPSQKKRKKGRKSPW